MRREMSPGHEVRSAFFITRIVCPDPVSDRFFFSLTRFQAWPLRNCAIIHHYLDKNVNRKDSLKSILNSRYVSFFLIHSQVAQA